MKRVTVLHLITILINGGAQRTALAIASGLDREKYDVVFASGHQGFCVDMAKKWHKDVIIIPHLVREISPLNDLMALLKLYLFIKRNKFDIVNTHTSKAGTLGRLAAKLAGVPIIFYVPHGSIYNPILFSANMRFLFSRIENFVASFTDKIITCSYSEKRDLVMNGIGTEDKYTTIYWGKPQEDFLKTYDRGLKRRELCIPEDAIAIGHVARLVPEKGHAFCLEAFKMVVAKLPKTILILVGDGELKYDIETKIKKLNLSNNVIMTGERTDIAEILYCIDIFLNTSIQEGTPGSIVEAMLMGKAIIATNVGGIPELIEDGVSGILVAPYDKEALVKAIMIFVHDKDLAKRLGEAARQHAKEKFNFDFMIKNISTLYGKFVKQKVETADLENEPMIYTPCNICGSKSYREICDIRISPIMVPSKLVRCAVCGLFYANPRLEKKVEEEYYRKRYHEIQGKNYWYEMRVDVFKRSIRRIHSFIKNGSLVDVGCGMGFFLDMAKRHGWEVKGVEISDSAIDYARNKLKLGVIKGDLPDAHFESECFDVVTIWNVIDQIYDPRSNLIEANRVLKKGGYLFIRVPNLHFHLKFFKIYKGGLSVFHLYSFDKNSIKKALELTGFSDIIVQTERMGQDIPNLVNIFGKGRERYIRRLLDFGLEIIYFITFGKIILSPSIFVIAKKKGK